MKAKFTKGPWSIGGLFSTILVGNDEFCVCEVFNENDFDVEGPSDEQVANAHLVAAAPEMYDFIESLKLDEVTSWEAEYILAKARGEDDLLLKKHNKKGDT